MFPIQIIYTTCTLYTQIMYTTLFPIQIGDWYARGFGFNEILFLKILFLEIKVMKNRIRNIK